MNPFKRQRYESDSDDQEIDSSDVEKYDNLPWPDSPINTVRVLEINDFQAETLKKIFYYASCMDTGWALPFVCKKWQNLCKELSLEKVKIDGTILNDIDEYAYENEKRKYNWIVSLSFFKRIEILQIECLVQKENYCFNYFDEDEQTKLLIKLLNYIFYELDHVEIGTIDISKMTELRKKELTEILDKMIKNMEGNKLRYNIKSKGMYKIFDTINPPS